MTRDEAKKFLTNLSWSVGTTAMEYWGDETGRKIREAVKALEEERETGRRIVITKMDGRTLYECSVCGKRVIFDDLMDLPNYCDHCGEKMEGAEE